MAKIIDPDFLNQGVEVSFITSSLLIRLNVVGNLSAQPGVSLQALYSFIKEEWRNDKDVEVKFDNKNISEININVDGIILNEEEINKL